MRLWALIILLLAILVLNYCVAADYDIPAGYADERLIELGSKADIDIGYDYRLIQGLQTNRVYGRMDAIEALAEMLRGTGWRYVALTNDAVIVEPGEQPLETCKPWLGAKAPLPPCKQAT